MPVFRLRADIACRSRAMFVATLALLLVPVTCQATVFNVRSYGAQGNGTTDDTKAIQATINAAVAAGSGNEVYLPAGNYLLGSDAASTDEELDVFQARKLTIQGDTGTSLLVPSSLRNIFYMWADDGLTFKKLALKRTKRAFTQMVIDSVNTKNNTVIVTMMPGYDPPNAPNVWPSPQLLVYSNPGSHTWGDHQKDCGFYAPGNAGVCWPPTVTSTKQISATQWQLTLNVAPQTNYVGAEAVSWIYQGGGSAFIGTASGNVLVQDVEYYPSGANTGWYLAGNSGPFTFDRFILDVMPATRDLVAGGGGSYTLNNHTLLTVENSRIVKVWDDVMDVGANSARVFDQVNSTTLDVDSSNNDFVVGDTFAVWDWTYKAEYQRQRAIAQAVSCTQTVCRITFDRAINIKNVGHASSLPEDQDGIDRVIDVNAAGSLVAKNNTFQSLHARDIIFRSSGAIITGNTFKNTVAPAIITGFDFDCDEGPSSSDDLISGNIFENVSSSNIVVGMEGDASTYSSVETDFSNITITNNIFGGMGELPQGVAGDTHAAIMMRGASEAVVTGNVYSPYYQNFTMVSEGTDYGSSSMKELLNNILISKDDYRQLLSKTK